MAEPVTLRVLGVAFFAAVLKAETEEDTRLRFIFRSSSANVSLL
jgi:hypothetical protein